MNPGKASAATKVTPAVRAEVVRLLGYVPSGLSADAMARIGRLSLPAVETVLGEMERAGDVDTGVVVFRGQAIELWRRR